MSQKTALVTGASRGLGKVFAEQLVKNGMRVLTPGRQQLDLCLRLGWSRDIC